MDKPLDLDAVQAFVLAADLQSFTRAAEALDSTQSAISFKLKKLEQRLGRRLLERTPRQVRLSAEGQQFLPAARRRVAAGFLLAELGRQNDVVLDSRRVSEALATIASTYEEPEKVVELYTRDPQLMQSLQSRVMEDQVVEWVAEHARLTEHTLTFNEVMRPGA